MEIKIITDSACDLPRDYVKENNIDIVCLTVNIKGEFLKDDLGETLKYDDFYKMVRAGEMPSTAQVNVGTFEEIFRKYVSEGKEIIYISLASSLSGTFNSANIAKSTILDEFPEARIELIDSVSVSLGEGALVYYLNELKKKGTPMDGLVKWAEENKKKIVHAIVLDDLNHLKRGGRISGATAIVGSILGIKPTLKIDLDGKLIPGIKIKGRKKSLRYLVDEVKTKAIDIENQTLFICHADCNEDAEDLKKMILEEVNVKNIITNSIGAVIGTHGGPGAIATIFLGNER